MSLSIPCDAKHGGGVTRTYKKNASQKINQFKIKIDLLHSHYNKDHLFYLTNIRDMFSNELEFLHGESNYQLLYDTILIHNYLLSQLEIHQFEYHVRSIMERFSLLDPLFSSFAYLLEKEEDELTYDRLLEEVKTFIEKNKIEVDVTQTIPKDEPIKTHFYEYMEKMHIHETMRDMNLVNMVQIVQKNMKLYIHVMDILLPYINELELFYTTLADSLYKKRASLRTT